MNKSISKTEIQNRVRKLTAFLFGLWLLTIVVPVFYARELSQSLPGWPLHYWISAQGALLVFLMLVVIYALLVNRWEAQLSRHDVEDEPTLD